MRISDWSSDVCSSDLPMMWDFGLWGLCHIAVFPDPSNLVLAGSIAVLALVGAALQDSKKERLQPDIWRAWEAKTSYWPFAAILGGREIGRASCRGRVCQYV